MRAGKSNPFLHTRVHLWTALIDTIALRKSKLKCFHSGTAPCQRCRKSGISHCVLSRPMSKPRRSRARRGEIVDANASPYQDATTSTATPATQTASPCRPHSQSESPPTRHRVAAKPQQPPPANYSTPSVDVHIMSLANGVVLKAVNVFINAFPELAIIHLPTFIQEFQTERSPESRTLLGAVLAVTKAQLSVQSASWADQLLSRDHYALYAEDMLGEYILQPPKLQVVQALLIITLHEWGTRDFHKAWMYCGKFINPSRRSLVLLINKPQGIAVRIMQALHSSRVAPYPLDITSNRQHDAVSLAIETRTYWACFVMDCMVNSGTYNPPMLPMSEMEKLKIARPLSAVEFAFGPDAPPQTVGADRSLAGQSTGTLDVTQSFEILVGGFDIWAQVMTFIFNDGRRAPGMCAPHNCPWVPGSPWFQSRSQLEAWRAGQHRKLRYPSNSVAVHMTLGFGETFVYLNLLYYVR